MTAYELKGNGSACRFIDGEAVLINAETSAYYSMNRTGAFVLCELLVSGRQQDEIAHILKDRFGAQSLDLNDDVGRAIAQLEAEGLIVARHEQFIASEIEGAELGRNAASLRAADSRAPRRTRAANIERRIVPDPMDRDHARVIGKELQLALSSPEHSLYFHGTSMLPFLREGDLVVVRPVAWRDLSCGDIVTYRHGERFPTRRIFSKRADRLILHCDGWKYLHFYAHRDDILGRVEHGCGQPLDFHV